MIFVKNFSLCPLVKTTLPTFCSLGDITKKLSGEGNQNLTFFGFCAAVFSSTALLHLKII
jgi:hypothetical protein